MVLLVAEATFTLLSSAGNLFASCTSNKTPPRLSYKHHSLLEAFPDPILVLRINPGMGFLTVSLETKLREQEQCLNYFATAVHNIRSGQEVTLRTCLLVV